MSIHELNRAKLQERLQELTSRLDACETGSETWTQRTGPDDGSVRQGGELLVCADQTPETMAEVSAALSRFDSGTYGQCMLCGETISAARLERVPTATLCAGCASSVARTRALGEETRMDIYEKKAELLARINAAGEERHEMLPELQSLVSELESHGNTISANLKYMLAELEDEAREADMDNFPV
ncbi:TraR/DksA family transcriptional regulator [Donghicola eburneus]|uniref:TraR/DksA family transcriptional regulator n=1 Tax=Donghicola eburneus TaxID=393278 RepID=UPI000932848A|nr:TraR/DksA C4-type zinc finger protein [Donghicola eburneus]